MMNLPEDLTAWRPTTWREFDDTAQQYQPT